MTILRLILPLIMRSLLTVIEYWPTSVAAVIAATTIPAVSTHQTSSPYARLIAWPSPE